MTKRRMALEPTTIACFAEDFANACAWYRIKAPYDQIRQRGSYIFDYAPQSTIREGVDSGTLPLGYYQVFVFPRIVNDETGEYANHAYEYLSQLQQAGKVVVWETDDDYTGEHREVMTDDQDAMCLASLADAVTVSTPHLAEVMRPFNENVYILPNCIDVEMWKPYRNARVVDGLTIGLGGTATHYNDWGIVVQPLREIMKEFPVKLVMLGYTPDYLDWIPEDRLVRLPFLPYFSGRTWQLYPLAIRQIDIGLAPLDHKDPFNLSKSAVKVLEYQASYRRIDRKNKGGAVAIASKMPVYETVIEHGANGLLADNTEDGWYKAIREAITNEALRRHISIQGHRWVKKHRSIKDHAHKWLDAYRAILKGVQT